MRHIERIVLRNYKSLAEIDLEMRSLNVLIGQNGSGKSNFLNFFHLLREGADERLQRAINLMGGFSQVAYYGHPDAQIDWDITFGESDAEPDQSNVIYKGALWPRGTTGYSIQREEVEIRGSYYLRASDGRIRLLVSSKKEEATDLGPSGSDQELVIAQLRDRNRYPVLAEIREMLVAWSIFRGFGDDVLANIRDSQLFNAAEKLRLDPSGKNLVSVLQQLANTSGEYEAANDRLNDAMQAVFDDFKRLDMLPFAAGRGTLNYRSRHFDKSIPALSMSDGQLRFLGLAVLLLLPDPPALIAIDEPEIGMHPQMLTVFAELLKEAAKRTQIILSTHSPELIDLVAPEDVIVAERENGATTLHRLTTSRLKGWLERYTLGKLWTMGKLEAP